MGALLCLAGVRWRAVGKADPSQASLRSLISCSELGAWRKAGAALVCTRDPDRASRGFGRSLELRCEARLALSEGVPSVGSLVF